MYIENAVILERSAGQYRPFYNSNNGGGAMAFGNSGFHASIQSKKSATIEKWYSEYQKAQNLYKKEKTQSFINNFQNLAVGTYIWNGTDWVKQ